jgi:hypothetical protein
VTWSEAEYTEYLQEERRLYAWVMRQHANLPESEAWSAAVERYPYEPSDAPYRGLIFHDEAWHWAMLAIHGEGYWIERPELAVPSPEYRAVG